MKHNNAWDLVILTFNFVLPLFLSSVCDLAHLHHCGLICLFERYALANYTIRFDNY